MYELHLLDDLDEAAYYNEPPPTILPAALAAPWWHKYQDIDQYDWQDPWFKRLNRGLCGIRAISLTQRYFMLVEVQDYLRMTRFPDGSPKRWHVKIQRDPIEGTPLKLYAERRGRGKEPRWVYAHREILGCLDKPGVGDHINGEGLDNRRSNLLYVSRTVNNHNTVRTRTDSDLPQGVERRGKNRHGQQLYGGKRCKRLQNGKVRTFRSKRTWLSPEPAARWYRNELKRICKRVAWAHEPKSVTHAIFPPLMESEPVAFPQQAPRKESYQTEEIPF